MVKSKIHSRIINELHTRIIKKYIQDTKLIQFYPSIEGDITDYSSHKFNTTFERVLLNDNMREIVGKYIESKKGNITPDNYNEITAIITKELFYNDIDKLYNEYHRLKVQLLDYEFRLNNVDNMYEALSKYYYIKNNNITSKKIRDGIYKLELPSLTVTTKNLHSFVPAIYDEYADELIRSGSLKTKEKLDRVKDYLQLNLEKHVDNILNKEYFYDIVELREFDIKEGLKELGLYKDVTTGNIYIESTKEFDLFLQSKLNSTKLREFYPHVDSVNPSNYYSKKFTYSMLKYISNPFIKSDLSIELQKKYNTKTMKDILENKNLDKVWDDVVNILTTKHLPKFDSLYKEVTSVPIYSKTGMEFDRVLPFNQFTLSNLNQVRMYLGTNLFIKEYVPERYSIEQVIDLHKMVGNTNDVVVNELDYAPIYVSSVYDVFGEIISDIKLNSQTYYKNEILSTFDMDKQLDILNNSKNDLLNKLALNYFEKLKTQMNNIEQLGGIDARVSFEEVYIKLMDKLQNIPIEDTSTNAFEGSFKWSKKYTIIKLTINYLNSYYKNEFINLLREVKEENPTLNLNNESNYQMILNNYYIPKLNEILYGIDNLNQGNIVSSLKPFIIKYGKEITNNKEFQGLNLGVYRFNYMVDKMKLNYQYPSSMFTKFVNLYKEPIDNTALMVNKVPERDRQRMERSKEFIKLNKDTLSQEYGVKIAYVENELSLKIIVPSGKENSNDSYLIDVRPYQCTVRSLKNVKQRHTITSQQYDNTPSFILKDILLVLHRMMGSRVEISEKYRDITLMIVNKIYNLQYKNLTL